ncbi:MAG: hypothetical protein KKE20_04950 [Nanoarchaeota archaeon]|nr:hypothetical protein [Nanoarchaeota archaeon]
MEIEQFLEKLGISQYEKQAYIALLRLGRAKSRQISKESNVSYGRIYEILEKLEQKGLISILPTEPKTFEAINPRIALKLMLKKKTEEIAELQEEAEQLKIPARIVPETIKDKTIVLHGRQKQLQMIGEMNERAKKEIMTIPGVYEPNTYLRITAKRALKRGVKIRRLLRAVTPKNKQILKEDLSSGAEIKQRDLSGLRLKIIDRKEAILSIVDPKTKDRISVYTTNKDFANSMATFFESLWEKSRPIRI